MPLKRFWLIHQSAAQIITIATTIFVDFYIWESTHDISKLLEYNLGLFIILPLGVLFSGLLSEYAGIKVSLIFAHLIQILFLSLLLVLGVQLFSSIFLFGLLAGLVAGVSFAPEDIITAKLSAEDKITLGSKITAVQRFLAIITPLAFALLIEQASGSFQAPFTIALSVLIVLLVLAVLVEFPALDNNFAFLDIFSFPGTNPNKALIAKSSFLNGIREGLGYSLIGVLTLGFVGSLTNWSLINIALSLVVIFTSLLYKRFSFASQPIISLGLGAVLLLAGSAFFAANFSLPGILAYLVAAALFTVLFGFGFSGSLTTLANLDTAKKDLNSEYSFLISLFQALGMIVPISILLWMRMDFNQPTSFQILIIVVGLIPFIILNSLKDSFYLTHPKPLKEEISAETPAQERSLSSSISPANR